MKKSLRYSLLGMLMMLCGTSMAQTEVTIDFDNDYQTLFPTIEGLSSSANSTTGAEASSAGDITVATTSTAVNGVSVTVSAAAEGANTPNRLWTSAPRLRMYSGTFTVTSASENITKIEFTGHNTNFNLSTTTGTLSGKTWAGEAKTIVFDVAKNTQINKIVVTLGGDPGTVTPDDPNKKGSVNNPYTVEEAQALLATMAPNVKTDEVYIRGTVSKVDEISVEFGNATYYISSSGDEEGQLEVYRGKYLENTNFTAEDQIMVDDVVIVCGQLVNYRKSNAAETDPVTPEVAQGNYLYQLNGQTKVDGGDTPGPQPEPGLSTCADVIGGEDGTVYRVKGLVTEIRNTVYGNFMLKDATGEVYVYGTRDKEGNNGANNSIEAWGIEVGDSVTVEGPRKTYNTTIELVDVTVINVKKNGTVDPGTTPEVELITVARAIEICNGLADRAITTEVYQVKGFVVGQPDFQRNADGVLYGNVNLDIADTRGGADKLTVYRAKSYDGVNFTEETINLISEGDEVIFEGKLQNYGGTPELASGGKLISINGLTNNIANISADRQDYHIYNLQGQRVTTTQRGLYIVDGKKYLVK